MLEKSMVRMAGIMLSPSSRLRSSEDSLLAYLEHQLSVKASPTAHSSSSITQATHSQDYELGPLNIHLFLKILNRKNKDCNLNTSLSH